MNDRHDDFLSELSNRIHHYNHTITDAEFVKVVESLASNSLLEDKDYGANIRKNFEIIRKHIENDTYNFDSSSVLETLVKNLDGEPKLKSTQRSSKIVMPPGHNLAAMLQFLVPKKQYEMIFEQSISDMRQEYFEALKDGNSRLASLRRLQIYPIIFITFLAWITTFAGKRFAQLWKLH